MIFIETNSFIFKRVGTNGSLKQHSLSEGQQISIQEEERQCLFLEKHCHPVVNLCYGSPLILNTLFSVRTYVQYEYGIANQAAKKGCVGFILELR